MAAAARPLGEAGNGTSWDGWMMLDLKIAEQVIDDLGVPWALKDWDDARFYDAIMIHQNLIVFLCFFLI